MGESMLQSEGEKKVRIRRNTLTALHENLPTSAATWRPLRSTPGHIHADLHSYRPTSSNAELLITPSKCSGYALWMNSTRRSSTREDLLRDLPNPHIATVNKQYVLSSRSQQGQTVLVPRHQRFLQSKNKV